ncbi:MAG: cupin domain-containing protein [Rhizobiales bacterium]|nr:cupin domain-containing protein [Hyphomicrobiales bacterium]
MTAEEVRALLDLKPHPTCGYVRVTYVSPEAIPAGALPAPFEAGRPLGSALIFQVTPERHVQLHRIRNDQFYHYYLGDPIEVIMLKVDGSVERAVCGPDIMAGNALQLFIPGNTFHTARLAGARNWFLGASTEWPGVEPADVELGDLEALCVQYPGAAADLREFAKG